MKNLFCKFWCLAMSFGYARAASTLAREGRHEEAKRLMLTERNCKC